MAHVLYLTYDGLLEPLGQSQVLSYLLQLSKRHQFFVVSYEKPSDFLDAKRREALKNKLTAAGITWKPLIYHKRFSVVATALDVALGLGFCYRLLRQRSVQIVHARSYVPSLIALRLKQSFRLRYIFDMRGFWPDEKVDAGTWSRNSWLYQVAKQQERIFLSSADAVVSLTEAGVNVMRQFDYLQARNIDFTVIPTCADLQRFTPPTAPRSGPFTFGYVGNAAGWYCFEPVVAAFEAIRTKQPDARFLIVNQGQQDYIRAQLSERSVPVDKVEIVALNFQDVPEAIRKMDATAFFIRPTFSKQASAPTKLAEFLGCGVPCLVNDGVGDMGRIVRKEEVGVVIDEIGNEAAAAGALQLLKMARDPVICSRCRDVAQRYFSLDIGVKAYDALYRRLELSE